MEKTPITVEANGEPGSFARRVQEDPRIAVEMLEKLQQLIDAGARLTHCDGAYVKAFTEARSFVKRANGFALNPGCAWPFPDPAEQRRQNSQSTGVVDCGHCPSASGCVGRCKKASS